VSAAAERAAGVAGGAAEGMAAIASPLASGRSLAAPFERCGVGVPAAHRLGEPGHELLDGLGVVPVERSPYQDALDRLSEPMLLHLH
jgi:hypothetical protein